MVSCMMGLGIEFGLGPAFGPALFCLDDDDNVPARRLAMAVGTR